MSPLKGFKHSESAKIRIKMANMGNKRALGYRHTPETKRKLSESHTGSKNWNWKGGKTKSIGGFEYIGIYSEKCGKGHVFYKREHRLVVEMIIGRELLQKEVVHHCDGIKNNNDPKNLMAFTSQSAHLRFHNNPNSVKPEEIIFDGRKLVAEIGVWKPSPSSKIQTQVRVYELNQYTAVSSEDESIYLFSGTYLEKGGG